MAITLGVGTANHTSTSTSTVAVTLNGCTAGRGLVIISTWYDATMTISSVAVSGESNATLIGSPLRNATLNNVAAQLAFLANITGSGNKTVTITFSGSPSQSSVTVIEVQGQDNTAAFSDGENGSTGNSANPSITVTGGNQHDAVLGVCIDDGGNSTIGSGFTDISGFNTLWYENMQYKMDVGATTSITFDRVLGASNWAVKAAAFKAAGGAAVVSVGPSQSTSEHPGKSPGYGMTGRFNQQTLQDRTALVTPTSTVASVGKPDALNYPLRAPGKPGRFVKTEQDATALVRPTEPIATVGKPDALSHPSQAPGGPWRFVKTQQDATAILRPTEPIATVGTPPAPPHPGNSPGQQWRFFKSEQDATATLRPTETTATVGMPAATPHPGRSPGMLGAFLETRQAGLAGFIAPPPTGVVFRKTLSGIGTHTGGREARGDG